jgi:hypothetical protein
MWVLLLLLILIYHHTPPVAAARILVVAAATNHLLHASPKLSKDCSIETKNEDKRSLKKTWSRTLKMI